ncbi:thioredoxin reductase [Pandoraea sputorum]|uniref:Formate dehydrogenase-O subunit gamma n=2 Tax=Pandoraea sputorum TaxID=93222 RepID=A0A239SBY6_9BURK|nr:cytochrome b/b6 domain-containing protein [Pandoraea sputorum]SNU82712.1 formate dehydrogenase-O subunit gamma [Pandoraea sputorum]VVE11277.1 thioredoxin reductase [Pandoraea sputorum]VVE84215.1 thioredoxin reductase [Pandoraea sputorum]
MTTMTKSVPPAAQPPVRPATVQPWWLRVTHWLNVLAVVVMVMSGWRIYNASPIFPFRFPNEITLGGWLGGALQWHFAAMWLLVANGLIYLTTNAASGRFSRRFFPLTPRGVVHDLFAALRGRLTHDDPRHYNQVQRAAYLFAVLDLVLLVASGLAVWKPVQLGWLCTLFGGFQGARLVHFIAMAGLVGFVVVHVAMVALVPRTLRTMITGR